MLVGSGAKMSTRTRARQAGNGMRLSFLSKHFDRERVTELKARDKSWDYNKY